MMAFAKMPVEAFTDHRLTLKQIRVLGAILTFADRDGVAHPKALQIAERCGMLERHVSTITTQLAELGWLEKTGNGGKSTPAQYRVTPPDLGSIKPPSNQGGKCNQNPPRFGEQTPPDLGSNTPPDLGGGKKQTIEQTNNRPEPVPEKIVERRKGKSPVTIERFLEACKETGELPIPENDPVFEHAERAKVPRDFLRLCWLEFREINRQGGKRYKDWRAAFRNCVRSEWYKLWYTDGEGNVSLTSKGNAALLRHRGMA